MVKNLNDQKKNTIRIKIFLSFNKNDIKTTKIYITHSNYYYVGNNPKTLYIS